MRVARAGVGVQAHWYDSLRSLWAPFKRLEFITQKKCLGAQCCYSWEQEKVYFQFFLLLCPSLSSGWHLSPGIAQLSRGSAGVRNWLSQIKWRLKRTSGLQAQPSLRPNETCHEAEHRRLWTFSPSFLCGSLLSESMSGKLRLNLTGVRGRSQHPGMTPVLPSKPKESCVVWCACLRSGWFFKSQSTGQWGKGHTWAACEWLWPIKQ